MKNDLLATINDIRGNTSIATVDEASIKAGVILRMLSVLGWNTFNIEEVRPEYTVGTRRVDLSLRLHDMNKVFIEAKRPNECLEIHQEQLLEYSFKQGVRLAVLTNGITWWFYLPLTEGSWDERRFFSADLLEQEPESIAERFIELLSKANVMSGNAVKNAEHLYTSKQRQTALRDALPRAWSKLIDEPDDLIVELLSDTAEKISGFRPETDDVRNYIRESCNPGKKEVATADTGIRTRPRHGVVHRSPGVENAIGELYTNKRVISFSLFGKHYTPKNWKELWILVATEVKHSKEILGLFGYSDNSIHIDAA